jgi:tetratricopeptide (TPR) repeat protein
MSRPSREALIKELNERLADARRHRSAGRSENARAELTQALAFAEKSFGEVSPQVDKVCLAFADFHYSQKEPDAELAFLERRVRIRKADAGIPQVAEALCDVAQCHRDQRRPADAEAHYRKAIGLCDPAIPAHSEVLRQTLRRLGSFLNDRERYADAEKELRLALEVCRREEPVPTVEAARVLMTLAESLFCQGRGDEARKYVEVAEPVATHRSHRPTTGQGKTFYYLGNWHQHHKRHAEAERAYAHAIHQTREADDTNFTNLAYIFQAAANNDLRLDRRDRAVRRLEHAYAHLLRSRERHHPDVLSVRQDLVNIHVADKQYDKAEPLLQEMVTATEHPDFTDEPAKERYLNNLGFVQVHLEEFPKAEANLRRALLSAGDDKGCFVIKNLGLMYQKMGYVREAIAEYRKALPLFEQHHSKDHPMVGFIRQALTELENPAS